jgi:hypothetical protein
LLIAVEGCKGDELVADLKNAGIHDAVLIGEIRDDPDEKIYVVA